jgi:hypothetical protein
MKVLTFIPVYNRRKITAICYEGLKRACDSAPDWLDFRTLIIASNEEDIRLAQSFGFDVIKVANNPLGRKFNTGLEHALRIYDFDYLFQINSDNILHVDFWSYFVPFISQQAGFFGCNHIAFYDSVSNRLIQYLYKSGCGIRFIRRDILENAAIEYKVNNLYARATTTLSIPSGITWIPRKIYRKESYGDILDRRVRLWSDERNSGLDDNSSRKIRSVYDKNMRQSFPFQSKPISLVIDIKSETNIHSFSEFVGDREGVEIKGNRKNEVLSWFPEINNI